MIKLVICVVIAIALAIVHVWVDTKIKKKGDKDDA